MAQVEYLVVAGGGGGGSAGSSIRGAGGGGAGGYQAGTGHTVTEQAYTITVGTGGAGAPASSRANGAGGVDSSFSTITANAGGYGAKQESSGGAGGSGGGSGNLGGAGGTASQGNAGGAGSSGIGAGSGGGGHSGAGAVGQTNDTSPYIATGGAGGAGTSNSISGSAVTYAVGGDGGDNKGLASTPDAGADGTDGRGNGGGGATGASTGIAKGGDGGDGIVIIRYLTDGSDGIDATNTTGGTKTTSGSYTIHTFTSSGTFTVVETKVHVATLTIDNTKVAADATDFPVYVDLSDLPASFWDVVANGGGDIRVFKSDDTTELPREVVSCDTATDTGELHFKYSGTLSSSADTVVHIYANGVSSDYAVTATYGRNNVWTGSNAVYHLIENTGSRVDATGNGYSLTEYNSVPATTGKLGSGSSITRANSESLRTSSELGFTPTTNFSSSFWFSAASAPTTGQYFSIAALYADNGTADGGWRVGYANDGGTLKLRPYRLGSTNTFIDYTVTLTLNTFYHGVYTWDGSTLRFYLNGTEVSSGSNSGTVSLSTTTMGFGIGENGNNASGDNWNGVIDETKMSTTVRSADWITTEYNNQNSPSTFYSAAAVGGGGTTYNALAFCSF